jgi:hypothetical protein
MGGAHHREHRRQTIRQVWIVPGGQQLGGGDALPTAAPEAPQAVPGVALRAVGGSRGGPQQAAGRWGQGLGTALTGREALPQAGTDRRAEEQQPQRGARRAGSIRSPPDQCSTNGAGSGLSPSITPRIGRAPGSYP